MHRSQVRLVKALSVLSVFSINGLSLHEVMLVLRPWDGFLLKS